MFLISTLKYGNFNFAKEHVDFDVFDDNVVSKMSQLVPTGLAATSAVKGYAKDIPIVGDVMKAIGGLQTHLLLACILNFIICLKLISLMSNHSH